MSILRDKPQNLPPDAIVLDQTAALAHQMKLIKEWDNLSESWPIKYGVALLGAAASLSGVYINGHFRRKLKLRNIGFMTTYMPIVALPGMLSTLAHKLVITHDIVLERTACPVCLQTKAGLIQAFVGFVYPVLLAPAGNFMYAARHHTIRLPDLLKDFKGCVKLMVKFGRPIGTQLSFILISQALFGSYFTYLEGKSYYTIQQRMSEIEKEYESDLLRQKYDQF